jgi:hypothetical protein
MIRATSESGIASSAMARRRAADRREHLRAHGLREEPVGRGGRLHGAELARLTGEHHSQSLRLREPHPPEQLGAVHAGHSHVGDDRVERRLLERLERLRCTLGEDHLPLLALGAQAQAEALQDARLVIHEQEAHHRQASSGGGSRFARRSEAACGAWRPASPGDAASWQSARIVLSLPT